LYESTVQVLLHHHAAPRYSDERRSDYHRTDAVGKTVLPTI
jgi:hypothetical protein